MMFAMGEIVAVNTRGRIIEQRLDYRGRIIYIVETTTGHLLNVTEGELQKGGDSARNPDDGRKA